jgi:hypothetical protein
MTIGVDTISVDGVTVFADADALHDALKAVFFLASSPSYAGEFSNFTALTSQEPAGTAGRFAYVLNSEGTKWLPGSIGGSFYGAGWYYDTGSVWSNKNDEIFEGLQYVTKDNQIIVNQSNVATTLGGTIDSTKEYFIDGQIDLGSIEVIVPITGIEIKGYSFDTSKLISSANNYTMFKSNGGASGNVLFTDLAIEVSGTSSQVYNLTASTGFEAIECNRVNYDNCTSRGSITSYRQGLESGVGYFGGTPELELIGSWVGGFRITTSIARDIGTAVLFKAGAGFLMNGRFLSDLNMEGNTNASLCDFAPSNIVDDAKFQLIGASFQGVTNPLPNITGASVKSRFRSNLGVRNTYVGARWSVTSEAVTTISAANTPVKVAGTTTYEDEQWFSNTVDNAFVYGSSEEIEVECKGTVSFSGGNNDQINAIIRQWDDSLGSYVDLASSGTITANGVGRSEGVSLLAFGALDQNDRIELWVENQTDNSDVTMQLGGLFSVQERPN